MTNRAILNAAMDEAEWMEQIVECAKVHGWLVYHTHDSRRSPAGFPDLVLCRGVNVIFLECKTEKGKATSDQVRWVTALAGAKFVAAAIVRPSDWPEVEDTLRRGSR